MSDSKGSNGPTDGARAKRGPVGEGDRADSFRAGRGLQSSLQPIGFWRGIGYPFAGMRFVYVRHPDLVRIWIFPIAITFLAIGFATWGSWTYSDEIVEWMWSSPEGDGFFAGMLRTLRGALAFLIFAVVWATSLFTVVALSNVIAAPFNDALSEEVERIVTGEKGPPFSIRALLRDLFRTVRIELSKLAIFLGVMAPLLCCSFVIPGVGQILYSAVGFVFTATYLAVDYIDWPACRRNKSTSYRWAVVRSHFGPCFGFGSGVFFLLFIPILNLVFMPAAVAGGTLLFLDLERAHPKPVAGPTP